MRGSCLCGDVAFHIAVTSGSTAARRLYQCHCSLCRKQGGGPANAALIVAASDLQWLAGRERIASYRRPTGFRADFCSRCGSPVPNPLRGVAYYWVPAGLLDDPTDLAVVAHLFVGSKAAWDAIPASGTHFDTMPELADFIRLMHPEAG